MTGTAFRTLVSLVGVGALIALWGLSSRFYMTVARRRAWTVALILIVLLVNAVVVVGPGQVGVQIYFGEVQPTALPSGIHLINPLMTVEYMSVRTQSYTMSATPSEGEVRGDDAIVVLSSEGLSISMDVTVLYHLDPAAAARVFRDLGMDYVAKVVRPAIRTVIRDVAVSYTSIDIYSARREALVSRVREILGRDLNGRGIIMEQVLLRNVRLPENVQAAINEKVAAEQEAQKMVFILQREQKEAERKAVEAQGIAQAQQIIAGSLTVPYLQWKYIETLSRIAESRNTTFVIMPMDQKLTPLIGVGGGGQK